MTSLRHVTHWGTYVVDVDSDGIRAIAPEPSDRDPSPIGPGMVRAHRNDALRVTTPAARAGWLRGDRTSRRGSDELVAIGWDEALDRVAAEIDRVREVHGNAAIFAGSYGWASASTLHRPKALLRRYLNLLGGYTDTRGTYSTGALEAIGPYIAGDGVLAASQPSWDEIAQHTQLVVAFGGIPLKNTQVEWGGVGRHRTRDAFERCRRAGVEFVNIGPLRSDVDASLGASWLAVRPGTDTALMLALIHRLVETERHDVDALERCCAGWAELHAYIAGKADGVVKDAAWAAPRCDIPASAITELADRIASRRTLVTLSWSLQRADHGEQPVWAAVALAAASGSLGRPGGGFGTGYGSVHRSGQPRSAVSFPGLPTGVNPVTTVVPVARIADLLERPGTTIPFDGETVTFPDTRLVYWCGGNPFHHHQDLNRLVNAWQRPDTVIVHESWWNPLARHADIVFPVATSLERDDIGGADGLLVAMPAAVTPPPGVPTDFEVFRRLAERAGVADAFSAGRTEREWLEHLYRSASSRARSIGVELPEFDEFWHAGSLEVPLRDPVPSPIAELRDDPEANPVPTPSGRIELFSPRIHSFDYADCPGHPTWFEPAEWLGADLARRYPLHLISNQPTTRLHSQYDHGGASLDAKVAGREPLRIHPADAAARGIGDGDVVRLWNDRGECLAGAIVTDDVRPGVLQLSTGAWYAPGADGDLVDKAGRPVDRHGNPNVLTRDAGTSSLGQACAAQTALVEVAPFEGAAPDHGAHVQPEVLPPVEQVTIRGGIRNDR